MCPPCLPPGDPAPSAAAQKPEGAGVGGGIAAAKQAPQSSVGSQGKVGSLGLEKLSSTFLCSFTSSLQPSDDGWDRAVKQECGSKEK